MGRRMLSFRSYNADDGGGGYIQINADQIESVREYGPSTRYAHTIVRTKSGAEHKIANPYNEVISTISRVPKARKED